MRDVKPELSGKRDLWINDQHRNWGWDCPFVDFDFLGLEYDTCQAVVLIEYKDSRRPNGQPTEPPNFEKANYKTLRNAANKLEVPLLIVHYNSEWNCFKPFVGNDRAKQWVKAPGLIMSEIAYVTMLYDIRKRPLPSHLANSLSIKNPWQRTG
jgi:hypothetical protein